MARPAGRKEWLEIFLSLADRNRPAREFRTRLGLKLANIPGEIAKIGQHREELRQIVALEELKNSKAKRAMTKRLKRPACVIKKVKKEKKNDDNKEALGPREDSSAD